VRVTFLLPGGAPWPSGGVKVVYEYANALVARGHEVTVVHPADLPGDRFDAWAFLRNRTIGYWLKGAVGRWRPNRWFAIDRRVRMSWVPQLRPELVPDADAIFATWWRTAEILASWPAAKGRKYYLVQHLETWGGPQQRVVATWRLPLVKIVIARWLEEFARELGERCHYIPNGLDFTAFGVDTDPAQRPAATAAMLYHEYDWKGSGDGIAALQMAKSSCAGLRAELFGIARAPPALPDWIAYRRNPSQAQLRALYNRAAIFVAPSWTEGWPLPPAEALTSGCALLCTDIGGHREYAVDEVTALMSPARDPHRLARQLQRLLVDAELRQKLVLQGNRFIQQFTWQRAAAALEAALMENR
jgi:glycosyltransferase involved in cell wall biosynthesis